MSCREPALMGVPSDPEVRCCFVAPPGKVLIDADYKAIEPRVLAEVAPEMQLIQLFNAGRGSP